jgi:hypothetical protein
MASWRSINNVLVRTKSLEAAVTADRYLVGLIGSGIGSSISPALHEREADRQGVRYLYQVIDLDDFGLAPGDMGELLAAARRFGFRGLNITHPCKLEVVKYLDDLAPEAAGLGAVNTVVFDGGGTTPTASGSPPVWPVRCPASCRITSCCSARAVPVWP